MDIENNIGKKLMFWRAESNYGQSTISEHLNISQSAYSQLEHGKRTLTLYEAYQLCKLYDKRMFELLPNSKVEINKSELFWVQKHEVTLAQSAFNSEKRALEKQNEDLRSLLEDTLSLKKRLVSIFNQRENKKAN